MTYQKGHFVSEETKIKIGLANKGRAPWNKGLKGIHLTPQTEFKKGHKPSKESRLKMSRTQKAVAKRGNKSQHWKGGRIKQNGYWNNWTSKGYVREHILIWLKANQLHRLPEGCIVHHCDGNKLNNNLSNLQLMTQSYHMQIHHPKGRKF